MLAEGHCSQGQPASATPHAQPWLALDLLSKTSHAQLVQIYLQARQPNATLKQYEICEKSLRNELDVDPPHETCVLTAKPVGVTSSLVNRHKHLFCDCGQRTIQIFRNYPSWKVL
jgi:DNA-binding SARP family transcriptional activator